ncbi:MAG: hypothetical protein J0L93_10140 [Deltaproteobacteria bacterium]|nr:hypothetical protein [Deltaproteobacteria bacterium]
MRTNKFITFFSLCSLYFCASSSEVKANDCASTENEGVSLRAVACVVSSVSEFDTALQMRGESPVGMNKESDYFEHRTRALAPMADERFLDMVQIKQKQLFVQFKF